MLRWVPDEKVPALYKELVGARIVGQAGAGTIVDVTSCPGTDTCKLGIASSRGLAGRIADAAGRTSGFAGSKRPSNLRIKVSGCFNSCGQHHVADLGFYGNSRNIGGYTVPHFQVMIGGQWTENGGSVWTGHRVDPIQADSRSGRPAHRALRRRATERRDVSRLLPAHRQEGAEGDRSTIWPRCRRITVDASFYNDWGDPREFTIGDMGEGECAGEVVSLADFGFTRAESQGVRGIAAARWRAISGRPTRWRTQAMLQAAKTLVQLQWLDPPTDPDTIVNEFRTRFVEPKLFWDTYPTANSANYLFARHSEGPDPRYTADTVHKLVEEANLFIDAAHKAHAKFRRR